ncbi:MAG TPA: cell division protein FtsB [Candidatus Competibacteraceae bacterium]|nr:cell division protein FtsB [Candidatus Competibacteraceae bacterium]
MRVLLVALLALLAFLGYLLWFNPNTGLEQVRGLERQIKAQQAENARLEERNRALEAEVKSLKEDLDAIEERARVELGMIRQDETFYHILEQGVAAPLPESPPPALAPSAAPAGAAPSRAPTP